MSTCVYTYNNQTYDYDKLVEELKKLDLNLINSIMFSLEKDKRENTVKKINEINKTVKFKKSNSIADSESDLDVDSEKYFTTQTFIDSGYFQINGEAPMFRLNMDEYLKYIEDKLKNIEHLPLAEIDTKLELIRKHWDLIAKDAADLHRIIVSHPDKADDRYYSGSSINTSFSGIFDLLRPLVNLIEKNIWQRQAGSTLIRNLNVEAELRNVALKILGHIDYLFVNSRGEIEIYNLKASIESESEWGQIKKEKFKYQLAFLKRILEYNGINSRNLRVNLIPVKIKYDESFENIIEVSALDYKSYDTSDLSYIFQKYDNVVSKFIDSKVTVEDLDESIYSKINNQLSKIFPERDVDIRFDGIKKSAKGWIKKNWRQIARRSSSPGWDIRFPGEDEIIHVSDTRKKDENEELVNLVTEREEDLFDNSASEKSAHRVISDIKSSFDLGLNFFSSSSKGRIKEMLSNLLNKYYENKIEDGKVEYKWKLIDNDVLTNANILVFKHLITNQIDVVTITPFDVSAKSLAKGRDNLLGAYLPKLNKENFMMESNFGNIEAVRTLTLLNEVLPHFNFDPKLGTMKIVGISNKHTKKGCEFEMSELLPKFNTIVKVVNKENKTLNMHNNFQEKNIKHVDWSELLILTWREVLESNPNVNFNDLKGLDDIISQKTLIDGSTIDGLETILSVEGKIDKLNTLLDRLNTLAYENGVPTSGEKLIAATKDSANAKRQGIAKVYCAALKALQMYNGDYSLTNEHFSQMSEYFSRPLSIPNTNVRTVAYMFQKSINKIANLMLDRYSPIRDVVMEFYKEHGYTPLRNTTIGDLANLFKNLYELDDEGRKTMRFKNPYSDLEDLEDHERKFLKKILYEINKVRYEMKGLEWNFKGIDDEKIAYHIEHEKNNYLDVPLERASIATRRTNIKYGFQEFGRRWSKTFHNPKEAFEEYSENLLGEEDKEERDDDIANLLAYNPFKITEDTENSITRENIILDKGEEYFETNVENLMIDFLEKHLLSVEYNKMLTRTKGILLDLYLRGESEDDKKAVAHTVKTIEDFLSVSVFNKSIMEETSLMIENILSPIRKAVTKCYIAANPTAAVRDTIQGILENTIRSLTKFLTDIDPSDVMFGYKDVLMEGPRNLMKITKYNLLNVKYRFSNLDVARISEGLKTGRGGINNIENWMFSTLRAPDYLNRMVLFSAKMHHDGCEDAYYIEEGKLKYDWKRDKRFSAYSKQDMSDMKLYNKLRSKYLSLMRAFNLENNTKLVEGDNLPDAYTLQLIETFKTFADNIYGSYNLSTKWKLENVAIGRNFTVFSTWLNGIVDVYTKKPQLSRNETREVQDTDTNGNLLYFDKYGRATTIEEGGIKECPVMKDVPLMVQGCWYTLKEFAREWKNNGWDSLNDSIWTNEINQRNLRRMATDLTVSLILTMTYSIGITPEYEKHKKEDDGRELIVNAIIEVLYKSSSNCFDGFKGPFAVIDYFGNSTNPATYKLYSRVTDDLMLYLFGNRTLSDLAVGSFALPRAFTDTYHMWVRDTK